MEFWEVIRNKVEQACPSTRARFQKAQRDELQGLVSGEQSKLNYNQVTRHTYRSWNGWKRETSYRKRAGFCPPPAY